MFEALASESAAYQALPSPVGVDTALSALASSTWLLLSRRNAIAGLLSPADFSHAATIVQRACSLPDERMREFALLALAFPNMLRKWNKQ